MRLVFVSAFTSLLSLSTTAWEIEYFKDSDCTTSTGTQSGSGSQCLPVLEEKVGNGGAVKWHGGEAASWKNDKCTVSADPHGPTVRVPDGKCFGVLSNTYISTAD